LGYIPQRFKVYGQQMANAPSFYLHQIKRRMYRDVVSVVREINPRLGPSSMSDTELGQVKEFGVVVQLAQRQGVPLSRVSGDSESQKLDAWAAFRGIAENILRKTAPLVPSVRPKATKR
jgi:hypothetical protein